MRRRIAQSRVVQEQNSELNAKAAAQLMAKKEDAVVSKDGSREVPR